MKKQLKKILEKAEKIDDEKKRKKFLLDQFKLNPGLITDSDIDELFEILEKGVENLSKKVDKFISEKQTVGKK